MKRVEKRIAITTWKTSNTKYVHYLDEISKSLDMSITEIIEYGVKLVSERHGLTKPPARNKGRGRKSCKN